MQECRTAGDRILPASGLFPLTDCSPQRRSPAAYQPLTAWRNGASNPYRNRTIFAVDLVMHDNLPVRQSEACVAAAISGGAGSSYRTRISGRAISRRARAQVGGAGQTPYHQVTLANAAFPSVIGGPE
jgi:hypothetical protein